MRRVATIVSLAIGAALLVAGCGDSEPDAAGETATLAVEQLRRLVTLSPDATGWEWSAKPQTRFASAADVERVEMTHAIQTTLRDAQVQAGLVRSGQSSWWDSGKKASSFATLFATSEGARSAMAADRAFAEEWFPEFEGQRIRPIDVAGLGEESWGVRGGLAPAEFVEIGWARANAVLAVYVNCTPCTADVALAARRWADAIDEAARAAAQ